MNFLPNLRKNSILTGPVESLCLACGCILQSEKESYAHISESGHRSKLEAVPRPERFKDDCIIKIKEGYYCPYCNTIFPTIKRVGIHVTEFNHRDAKNAQSITRQYGFIFVYDEVVIDERSWHGFDGITCFVCNKDYTDEEEHKKEVTHILNLIQSKYEFGNAFIYRKVDEDSFFCLICGTIYFHDEKTKHHESEQHLQHYDAAKKLGVSIRNTKQSASDEANNNTLIIRPNISENNTETNERFIKVPENKTISSAKVPVKIPISQDVKEVHHTPMENTKEPVKFDDKSNINANKPSAGNVQIKQPTDKCKKSSQDKTIIGNIKESTQLPNRVIAAKCDTNVSVPKIYNYIRSQNFVVSAAEGIYCTLCDHIVTDIKSHTSDKHHKILYDKHVARNSFTGNNDETDDNNKESEKNDVENELPFSEKMTPANKNSKASKDKKEPDANKSGKKRPKSKDSKAGSETEKGYEIFQALRDAVTNVINDVDNNNEQITVSGDKVANETGNKKKTKRKHELQNKLSTGNNKTKKTAISSGKNEPTTTVDATNHVNGTINDEDTSKKLIVVSGDKVVAKETTDSKRKTEKLSDVLETVSQFSHTPDDLVVNGKHMLGNLSLMLIVKEASNFTCVACNVLLSHNQLNMHILLDNHRTGVQDSRVLTSLDDEFVREVNSRGYHCGYCNLFLSSWKEMQRHLECYRHKDIKTSAMWRLVRYRHLLRHGQNREVCSILSHIRCQT